MFDNNAGEECIPLTPCFSDKSERISMGQYFTISSLLLLPQFNVSGLTGGSRNIDMVGGVDET